MPEIYAQLMELHNRLESHYKEVQDFEFTIEKGTLYCLQTRNGKMNARAMVRTSVEMFNEGLITKEKALLRVEPAMLEQLLVPQLAPNFKGKSLAQGLPASPGAASGKIVFDADTAEARGRAGEKIILVREETKPEDIHGFFQAQGILTSRGGKTSHAAVVARGMGKPCVSGCEAIHIDDVARKAPSSATPRCTKATSSPSTAAPAMSMPAKCRRWKPEFSAELVTAARLGRRGRAPAR